MKTVGQILQTARNRKSLSLKDISHKTKINLRYLEAIEANQFSSLPASAFTKGFLRNYAKLVDIEPEQVLAIFRRDYDQDDRGRIIPRGLTKPPVSAKTLFQPKSLQIISISVLAIAMLVFFIVQIIHFNSPPQLTISAPSENSQQQNPVIITGQTDPEAVVRINNRPITISQVGEFEASVNLTPGEHNVVIQATSRSEKTTTIYRHITVIPDDEQS